MKLAKTVLVASALALAAAGAYAADKQAKADPEPGFNNMDKNNDGKLTRAEAAGDKSLLAKWKEADGDKDGSLSRAEYLKVKAKKDVSTVKSKVSKEAREAKERMPGDNKSSNASTGSSK